MKLNQNIPCPVCKTSIPVDIQQLLNGAKFNCSNCNSSIGMAEESKAILEQTVDKLKNLKNNSSK